MSSKDRHYWAQLRLALTSGQWSAKYPAKAPDGTALPWSELFRKFNKHCKGFEDVAQVASYTQALALLLSANSPDEDEDDIPGDATFEYPLELGQECMLPEERIEEGKGGYEALMSLKSSNFDSLNFALAYYAYSLGNPAQCLSHLSGVPELLSVPNHIPTVSDASTRASTTAGHTHHLGLHVPSFSTGTSLSSAGGSFASLADSASPEIRDGRAWAMTETMRSLCLQGMSHERLSAKDPKAALKAYGTSLPLFETLGGLFSDPSLSASTPAANTKIFLQQRELWRWVERLLWRAIVVSARIAADVLLAPHEDVWTWFRQYAACSIYWPATFRTSHRSTVSVLYLRATILQHHPIHTTLPLSQSTTSNNGDKIWLHAARTVVNDYRAILNICTYFPGAGERNVRVEDFVDLCVGLWEAGGASGEGAGWVVDILWWATRLTFNSHRILRHMTRVLHVAGDTTLARRTLLLYAQVVGKAYEANHAVAATPSSSKNSSTRDLSPGQGIDSDADSDSDSDKVWVETLVSGARMLCRWAAAQPGLEGLKEVREAGVCIEKARTRLRVNGLDAIRLAASVDLAEEQDPYNRPKRLSAAHTFFLQACSPPSEPEDFAPDPAALYHLALSFAHPGPVHDLEQAIILAGRAVEADPREIRYWHLLGLLLAAAEKWTAAREILESGAAIGEDEGAEYDMDRNEDNNEGTIEGHNLRVPRAGPEHVHMVLERDFVETGSAADESNSASADTPPLTNGHVNGNGASSLALHRIPLIDGIRIPSAAAILSPTQDHPPPSKEDLFEHALQLRMTQGVLSEVIDGAEGAEEKWLEVFSWVAAHRAASTGQPTARPSMDGGRPVTEKAPSFVVAPSTDETSSLYPPHQGSSFSDLIENQDTLQPIPITISPATPESENVPPANSRRHNHLTKRSSSIERDTSKSKKVQQMLKNRVHQGRARVSTISRKIGNGVVKTGSLKRSNSTPDFHAILRQTSYQASSIHSRRRLSSFLNNPNDRTPTQSPPPPPVPVPPPPPPQERKRNSRTAHRNRLIADLWLMSAATFRRLGKIEQAKGAIQEAEVKDEGNPGVWVQLGLYYIAHGQQEHAMDAYQKALFIDPDDVSASVHLARLFLSRHEAQEEPSNTASSANVDLVAGMLGHLTRGNGWNVPEAWYYLAKAYGLQGRKKRERECLDYALALSASRGIREMGEAVGWCI
ncbi:hypothetical protein H0H87_002535 [Tephrocybe sp. NHM501043]|nr:hypothetical protein H0H87_002535 [Tephrocybe sp. NHM501043]